MSRFSTKPIDTSGSFGARLRLTREQHGFDLRQISFKLKIPEPYLRALEEESLTALPAGSYGRHFLRQYAQWLKLPVESLLAEYTVRVDYLQQAVAQPNKPVSRVATRPIKRIVLGLLAVILISYLGVEARRLFLPPPFELFNPPTNVVVNSLAITVNGRTTAAALVLLNGAKVAVTADGYFTQEVTLQPGLNTITLSARRAYSKPITVTREILVETLSSDANF